jgi:hypothetical protein
LENQPKQLIVTYDGKEDIIVLPAHGEVIFTIAENKVKFIETRDRKKI